MDNTPNEAAGAAQAPQTEATPNTNPTTVETPAETQAAQAPDMHGFTSEQLAEMQKFFAANGGFDKIKSRISNPEPKVEQNVMNAPVTTGVNAALQTTGINAAQQFQAQQPAQQAQPQYKAPEGSMSTSEYIAKQYFEDFANDPKYKEVFAGKTSEDLVKEMAGFNVFLTNLDGSINDGGVRRYLNMKAETIAAHQSPVTPSESAAPTVDYVPIGDSIRNISEARAVIMQDSELRRSGQAGHPKIQMAEEFLKKALEGKA